MAYKNKKIILDLCGGTGSWSQPYRDAGYDVRVITIPDQDVRLFKRLDCQVHGILAAPPCDHFSNSGAQYWPAKDADGRTLTALSIADACLRIIHAHSPVWWCLENPLGRIVHWIGPPVLWVQPHFYGDAYTKRTGLWGNFRVPDKIATNAKSADLFIESVDPVPSNSQDHWMNQLGGKSEKTKRLRSVTPPAFAKAFFQANP